MFALFAKSRDKDLLRIATQLRNSEFKNESIEYVVNLLHSKKPLDDAAKGL